MKKIEVEISPTGEVQVRPLSYKGEGCKQVTENLERALGIVINDQPTAEMQEQEAHTNQDAQQ